MREISKEHAMNAVITNDVVCVTELLEEYGFTKGDTPFDYTFADRDLLSTLLSFASAMAYRGALDNNLARELVERTTMTVNIFFFAQLVATAIGIKIDDYSAIPKKIHSAIQENNCTDEYTDAVEKLDDETFRTLIAFVSTSEIDELDVGFNSAIIQRIYTRKMIPDDILFAYMGLCQHDVTEAIAECLGSLYGALGAFAGFALLDELTNETPDGEDGEEKPEDGVEKNSSR